MKRILMLASLLVLGAAVACAQTWTPVWKMVTPPYLTLENITEMGIVKAGFDTDQDGWGEFLCAWTDLDTNAIMMYEATGDNTYELVWSWVFPGSVNSFANSFAGIAVGDFNNNGIVDIVVGLPSIPGVDPNPPRVWFFEWNGVAGQNAYGVYNSTTQTFDPSASWNFGLQDNYDFRPYSMTIEDIDKDGANELIVGVRAAGSGSIREVVVASSVGEYGGFWSPEVEWRYTTTAGGSNYSTTTGDLDKDGKKEIYMFIWNLFTMKTFECEGNGEYVLADSLDMIYETQGIDYGALDGVRVADVNADGVNELYIAGTEPDNKVFIITGITDVSQITPADVKELYTIPVTAGGKLRSMYIADPDHNGKANLMIAGESNGQIFSLEYKGSGNPADSANWDLKVIFDIWTESGQIGISPRLFYGSPAGDMDKDGKDEYVFVNYSPDYPDWSGDSPIWIIECDVPASVAKAPKGIPQNFQLLQNYPNPFNPTTTIGYAMPVRAYASLGVFNSLGQCVAELVNGEEEPGYHEVAFDATKLASGMYYYKLQAGNFVETKKMLVVK
jgi:hypothetical protein